MVPVLPNAVVAYFVLSTHIIQKGLGWFVSCKIKYYTVSGYAFIVQLLRHGWIWPLGDTSEGRKVQLQKITCVLVFCSQGSLQSFV